MEIDSRVEVCVILPTYNEKDNIILLINDIHQVLDNINHEIIVVDDQSSDGTFESVIRMNDSSVRSFLRRENRGLASAIRYGLERARGGSIIVMDSDFNHQPKYLPFMIRSLESYNAVFASRFLPGGGTVDHRVRYFLSALFNIFVRFFIGLKVSDSLYGFFGIKKDIVNSRDYDDIFYGHGDYCPRLLYYLQKKNIPIFEFPAVNGKRRFGRRKMSFFDMFYTYCQAIIRLKRKMQV